ncbi:TPA: HipA N-terminal domain-containing protein [Escherichia coli O25b:H4-ST131]|nr:HipA N-terminal domain-containing protein [Escherichia coli O25b:H4-ST131]
MPKLVTWMNNQRVGELTKLANGAHTFKYAAEWLASRYARPLSRANYGFFDGVQRGAERSL